MSDNKPKKEKIKRIEVNDSVTGLHNVQIKQLDMVLKDLSKDVTQQNTNTNNNSVKQK